MNIFNRINTSIYQQRYKCQQVALLSTTNIMSLLQAREHVAYSRATQLSFFKPMLSSGPIIMGQMTKCGLNWKQEQGRQLTAWTT